MGAVGGGKLTYNTCIFWSPPDPNNIIFYKYNDQEVEFSEEEY